MTRAYTEDEVRTQFLQHVKDLIDYWAGDLVIAPNEYDTRRRLDGLAFSILVALDGDAVDLPGFKVIPNPHPDDEAYHRELGENFYPDDIDIAGSLHEVMIR